MLQAVTIAIAAMVGAHAAGQAEAPAKAPPPAAVNPPPVVKATPGKVSLKDPASLVAALQRAGYKAMLTYDEGKPEIESSAAGATYYLYFQGCDSKEGCSDLMLQSAYDLDKGAVSIEQMNAFNKDNRWARAYLDDEGDPILEYDVMFANGQTDEAVFIEDVKAWDDVLGRFHKIIDW